MRYPTPDDVELTAAIRRYVNPETGSIGRYGWLLHGNFMRMDQAVRTPFLRQLAASARQASDHELAILLDSEWRSRLTASWLIGLGRREQFRGRIGELLLASELTYAGQGYCLALARFAATADAELLAAYLDSYLPQSGKRYDQPWALGACCTSTSSSAPVTLPVSWPPAGSGNSGAGTSRHPACFASG